MGGTAGNEMDRLKEIIQVIDRPLAFAERGGTVALKDLGRFISRQVTDALAEHVRPSAIEAELLRLAQLFTDYEQLPPGMRAARVTEARAVIVRLDQAVDAPSPTSGRPANRLSDYPIQYIRGVGPKKAEALGRIGIRTVEDAVWMLPWRYEDRSQCRSISSLVPGEAAMIEAQVERTALKVTNFKRRKLVEVAVADRTGRLHLIWFNQAYLAETFHVGQRPLHRASPSGIRGFSSVGGDPRRETRSGQKAVPCAHVRSCIFSARAAPLAPPVSPDRGTAPRPPGNPAGPGESPSPEPLDP